MRATLVGAAVLSASFCCAAPATSYFETDLPSRQEFEGMTLHWRADLSAGVVHIGIEAPLGGSAGGWIGFGVAEQSAGSMPGADVVIIRKVEGQWVAEDSYTVGYTPPIVDQNQDWTLVGTQEVDNTLYATLRRPLVTNDGQDRDIGGGTVLCLWARGSSMDMYKHLGTNRRVVGVLFYVDDELELDWSQREEDTDSVTISMENFLIPAKRTTYACRSHRPLKLFNGEDAWITRFEFINRNPAHNHHFIVHSCDHTNPGKNNRGGVWKQFEHETRECESPQGNYDEGCSSALFIWAVGGSNWTLAQGVGFLVSDSSPHGIKAFVIEMHYDNPNGDTDVRDDSTVVVYYTRKRRKHEVGLLTVGDPLVAAKPIPPLQDDAHYQFSCSSGCTSRWAHPITVIGSQMHMHRLGKAMYTVHHRQGGESHYINRADYYAYDSQQTRKLKPFVINPGDHLSTHCIFKNPTEKAISFNLGSDDEMCMEFIFYYPVLTRPSDGVPINFCGYITRFWEYPFINGTICGVDLLDKNDANFSRCNPEPNEVDEPDCHRGVWGQPGALGVQPPPCKTNPSPGFKCERVPHVINVDSEGQQKIRWINVEESQDPAKLVPGAGHRAAGAALAGVFLAAAAAALA